MGDESRWELGKSEGWECDGIGWDRMGVRWCELEGMGLGRVLEYGRVGGLSHCCCEMFLDHAISRERDVTSFKKIPGGTR